MTANLESLVTQAAEKEILEKELQIAQDLQKSLLPNEAIAIESIEVATFFEPSAAIGGDYFDLVRLRDDRQRLAVIIADVSGHGLPAGLRMAMFKAALDILVQERKEPEGILASLDQLVRDGRDRTSFVTATLSLMDLATGTIEITNAGHPPTYLIRRDDLTEIALPGTPLGVLEQNYGHCELQLEPNDVLVWLSDGFIEATDASDEAFGYERTAAALRGASDSVSAVRDRLLSAVEEHNRRDGRQGSDGEAGRSGWS